MSQVEFGECLAASSTGNTDLPLFAVVRSGFFAELFFAWMWKQISIFDCQQERVSWSIVWCIWYSTYFVFPIEGLHVEVQLLPCL